MKSIASRAKCYGMLSGTPRRIVSRLTSCTAKTSFGCVCGTMERAWSRRCWRKAAAPDTGVCRVFESEHDKWARDWMFGARREPERKFNWPLLLREPTERSRAAPDSDCFRGLEIMSLDPSLIRILTVDDHPLLRRGIAALVNTESDMKLVAEASSGEEAIEKVRAHRPDVTLMDIQLPGLN